MSYPGVVAVLLCPEGWNPRALLLTPGLGLSEVAQLEAGGACHYPRVEVPARHPWTQQVTECPSTSSPQGKLETVKPARSGLPTVPAFPPCSLRVTPASHVTACV